MKRLIPTLSLCAALFAASFTLPAQDAPPTFSLAWSEYPSWSVFGVAHQAKLIDGRKGELGPIEKKYGVDIELKEADYDTCLVLYGTQKVDAVCITNMDALVPSETIKSVGILPTSTSNGADACIVTKDITDVKQLKGKKVYGLAKTVSEYTFARNLELLGEKEKEHSFTNMDPAAAALAMQQKRKGYDAIVVWNPFVLETLNKRKDVHVLFDSTTIPGEIIDMVVVSQSSLDKPKGAEFAAAVIETFYAVCERMNNPDTRDETLIALGEKFSNLDLPSMRKVVTQTRFYDDAAKGLEVMKGDATKEIMGKVTKFCVDHEMVGQAPKIGYGTKETAADAAFRIDPSYIESLKK
jgi:NitT/TauT family transport system substrate-binding protein